MDEQVYLAPTELCDCEHARLKAQASEVVGGAVTPGEAAQRIFRFVRDSISFNATLNIYQKASQTLEKTVVDYCNKVNVQVALLRAAGVPARCHLVRVENEVLKPFLPRFLYDRWGTFGASAPWREGGWPARRFSIDRSTGGCGRRV